jgi:hypothetical protein
MRTESGAPLTFAVVAVKRITGPVGLGVCAIVITQMVIIPSIPSSTKGKAWLIRIFLNIEPSSGVSEAFYFGQANSAKFCWRA